MARYKRYFPVSHDFNRDPEIQELRDEFGDGAVFVWLEILSILDRHENQLKMSNSLLRTLSQIARKRFVTTLKVVNKLVTNGWLTPNKPFVKDLQITYASPNYAEYHRTRARNEDENVTNDTQIGVPPNLPLPSPLNSSSFSEEELREKEKNLKKDSKRKVISKDSKKPASWSLEEFIDTLRDNPAYAGINLEREIGKMQAWLQLPKAKGRKLTKQFLLNWLNKIDVEAQQSTNDQGQSGRRNGFISKEEQTMINANNLIKKLQEAEREPTIINP